MTTTDYTHEILTLQRARIDMQTEKASNRTTIKAKYAERIRQEIEDANEAAELRFARLLADAHAAGVPQSLLRSEVLRTNVWSRWVYWRDLAEIEPDRVVIANAKEKRQRENASFLWEDGTLTVRKNSRGDNIEPLTYDLSTNRKVRGGLWWPDAHDAEAEREIARDDKGFLRMLSDEIQRHIDAGTLANPEEEG